MFIVTRLEVRPWARDVGHPHVLKMRTRSLLPRSAWHGVRTVCGRWVDWHATGYSEQWVWRMPSEVERLPDDTCWRCTQGASVIADAQV